MYNTHIQTTLSLMGRLVFIEYIVTEEWAVEWYLNIDAYMHESESAATEAALELLELLLRVNHSDKIEEQLTSEFESRQYEEEQRILTLAAEEDIPF